MIRDWLERGIGGISPWPDSAAIHSAYERPPVASVPPPRELPSRSLHASPRTIGEHVSHQRGALVLTCVAVALGVFVVAQWQSQVADVPTAASRPAIERETVDRLAADQATLKQQIADLRAADAAQQRRLSVGQSAVANVTKDLAEQRALAGTTPLRGAGVEILLDDSNVHTLLPSDDPDNYIVHEYQIRDLANLLWTSGAAGIAVNGERFVNSTSVYCVGSTILINDTRTSPPYHIVAVGDVNGMQRALDDGNALRDLKSRVQSYGLVLKVENTGTFTIPAFDGSIAMKNTLLASEQNQ